MNKDKKSLKPIKKLAGILSTAVLGVATMIGVGFGFANSVENIGPSDNIYNDSIQIEAKVNIKSSDKDIKDAAYSIYSTLDFLGIQNSTVKTMGYDNIIITIPIKSYEDSENKMNSIEMMSDNLNNQNYINEIAALTTVLLFDGTLDFRTENGLEIFDYDENGNWKFNSENFSEGNTPPDPEGESTREAKSENVAPGDFYTEATIKHENGYPIIEIGISDKGTSDDSYINMFRDFNNFINSAELSNYVVWFDFDRTFEILSKMGFTTSEETMYTDISSNPTLRPLYVVATDQSVLTDLYENKIQLKGSFSEKEARYFVNKINNTNSFEYSNIKLIEISNFKTKTMLIVLAFLLLIMIIGIIFSFVSYFGLLGLISSIVFLLINLFIIGIVSSTGISITGLVLFGLFIIALLSAFIIWLGTNIYKKNNEDKFISVTTRFFDKFKKTNSTMFASIVSLVLILYVSGLLLNLTLTIFIYLIAIAAISSYLFSVLLLLPLIYLLDLLMEFSKEDYESKWNWKNGLNLNAENKINTNVNNIKQKTLGAVLIGVITILLSLIMGLTLYENTGSAVNSNLYGTQNYIYNVKVLGSGAEMDMLNIDENLNEAYLSESYYEYTKEMEELIINSFEDNGVKVNSINIVRRDEVNIENTIELFSSFGFQINSKTKITEDQQSKINESLSLLIFNEVDYISQGCELMDELSLSNGDAKIINSYTENKFVSEGIFSLLLIIITVTLIVLVSVNWGVSLAVLLTTILESIFIIAPIFILFIPYNFFIWLPIILLISFSAVIKVRISQKVKKDEIKADRWVRNAKEMMFAIPLFSSFLLILELILIGVYGFILMLPLIIITILIPFIFFWIQQYVYPYFGELMGDFRDRVKENKRKDDISRANNKDKDEVREEFIEGVNM